jgi:hypothetical protein
VDRDYGLLRWAPLFALAISGAWLVWRGRTERLREAIPAYRRAEAAGGLCAGAVGAHLLVAAFLAPTMFGFWFPPRHLVAALPLAVPLVAWGLRHAPRLGTALALVGAAASAWLYLAVRVGDAGLVVDRPDAPLGPLVRVLPRFDDSEPLPYALAAAAGAVALVLALREWRHSRQIAGAARARYSG